MNLKLRAYNILTELSNFFTTDNFDKLKDEWTLYALEDKENITLSEIKNGSVNVIEVINDEVQTSTNNFFIFSLFKFNPIVKDTIAVLNYVFVEELFNKTEQELYKRYFEIGFKKTLYLSNTPLIKKYPITSLLINSLIDEINETKLFIFDKIETSNSILVLKAKINIDALVRKFKRLYHLLKDNNIINTDSLDENEFTNLLLGKISNKTITFTSDNNTAVIVLLSIKPFYLNFNGRLIEHSKIFYTKQGIVFTQSNFNTSIHRLNSINNNEIEKLKRKISNILS